MRRRALQLAVMASLLGALSAWAVVLSMGPRVRARSTSDRIIARAQELAGAGETAAARQLIDEAIAVDQSNPRARRELAMHLAAERRVERAVEELRRVALAQPADSGAARELAALLWATGSGEQALQWFREAAARAPRSGLAHAELAHALIEGGDLAGGLRAAEQAVALSPHLQLAHLTLGRARWRSGDLTGARAAFEQALRLRPSDVTALLGAAAVSSELGLADSALEYARRAVAVAPDSPGAWSVLERTLAAAGRSAEAEEALARARSLEAARPRR